MLSLLLVRVQQERQQVQAVFLRIKIRSKSRLFAYGVGIVMCFPPGIFTSAVIPTVFFPRKLFQHVPGENATAGKLRSFLHPIEDRFFSFAANDGQAPQVDDPNLRPSSPRPAFLEDVPNSSTHR